MKNFGFVTLALLGASLTSAAQGHAPKPHTSSVEQQIRTTIQERHAAYLRSDRPAYSRYLDAHCVTVSPGEFDTAAQQLASVHPAPGETKRIDIDNLKVQDFGSTAIALYHQVTIHQFGKQSMSVPMQVVDSYRRQNGRWLMTSHAEVYDLTQRKAARVNPSIYRAYLGEYEWSPGLVDTVTRDGDKLLSSITGDEKPSDLLPLNETMFFVPGDSDDGLVEFVRDASGNVTHYVYTAHGQKIIAKKIK